MGNVIYLIWGTVQDYGQNHWRRNFLGYTTEQPVTVDGEHFFFDPTLYRSLV